MADQFYEGATEDRDHILAQFQQLGLLDRDVHPEQVVSGRNCQRTLGELTAHEFSELLVVLRNMTGADLAP